MDGKVPNNTLLPHSKKIVISIDSLFALKHGPYDDTSLKSKANDIGLEKIVTGYVDSIFETIATIRGFVFSPNYKLLNKKKPDFILSGSFGKKIATRGFFKDTIQYFINAVILDNFSKEKDRAFFVALKSHESKRDTYLIKHILVKSGLKWGIRSGGFTNAFIPINKLLHPVNTDTEKLSFSIDHYIKCKGTFNKEDKEVSQFLTDILNNILVFNQPSYPNKEMNLPASFNYNYYPNYLNDTDQYKKAKFNISAVLSLKNDSTYDLKFTFLGKDINLIVPAKIKTEITLNRKRIIIYHNYGEILLKLHHIFPQVIFQQRF